MERLAGKVAVVTGGAEGIGRGISEVFLEHGAAVAILDWNAETGTRTAAELAGGGGRAVYVNADISDEASVERAIHDVVSEFGALHVLVNNAAVFILKGLEATPDDWRRVMAVNIMGPALVTKHAVPHMRRAGGGAIVNVGSVSSFIAQKGFLTYSVTKAAVAQMTRCMALELADDGIRVNGVCPGSVWTAQAQRMVGEAGLTRAQAAQEEPNFGASQMLKRSADTREIGYATLFLASDEASFVTGENLMVDGGWTAQ